MASSESSSSDLSSNSSESTVVENLPSATTANMSFAVQRSVSEMKLVEKSVSSLMNTLDRYQPHLIDTDYAYFCRFGTDFLNGEMNKKARKLRKNGMENSMMSMVDSTFEVGSLRSGFVPMRQFYPLNATQNMHCPRAPSVVSSIVSYPRQPAFQRYMPPGHSSGVPPVDYMNRARVGVPNPKHRRQPGDAHNSTLHQAIKEVDEGSFVQNPQLPTPSTSSGDGDHIGERAKESKICKAVPKQFKGAIKLFDWSIKLMGEELYVTGTTRDKSQISSGPVVKYSHPTIFTKKESFLVVGQPCFGERTPGFVKTACSKGFPRQWKALSKRWTADRQARRKSTPKKTPERKNKNISASDRKIKRKCTPKKTPDRKNKNNSASGRKIKSISPTPKAAGSASKAKAFKSPPGKNVGKRPHNKNETSQVGDKENKLARRRSKSMEESVNSPVAAKQAKTKVVKSLSNPDVSLKKKNHRDRAEEESESESDGTEVSPINPAKRAVQQDLGSDTSWETSKNVSATPKALPKKVTKNKDTKGSREPKSNAKGDSGAKMMKDTKGSREPTSNAKGDKGSKMKDSKGSREQTSVAKGNAGAKKKGPGAVPKQPATRKTKQTTSNKGKNDGGSEKPCNIFGDEDDGGVCATDAFSAMAGDDLFSIPCSRSLTPNTLVASIQPDAGTIGRYTPPLQNVLHLFSGNSQKTNSSLYGSPSSLNNSRDNPVSKRVAKDVEATKKGGKKKQQLPHAEGPDELDDLVRSLKNPSNTLKTPTMVKKIFRNQRDDDDDKSIPSSDQDESMVY